MPEAGSLENPAAAVLAASDSRAQPTSWRPIGKAPATFASEEIRRVLPSVTERVANWKEFKPAAITIAPYPDLPLEFTATSIREESGRTVWTGRNAVEGAFLVAAATENEWHATLVIPGASTFEVFISGHNITLTEKNHDAEMCGDARALGTANVMADPAIAGMPDKLSMAGDAHTVDVLFFYDSETLAQVQGHVSTIETRAISHLEAGNAALDNSNVSVLRWRFAGAHQVPAYAATADLEDDLDLMRNSSTDVGRFVAEKSHLHGGDQAVLYVGGERNWAGIAWLLSSPGNVNSPAHSAVSWETSVVTLIHELTHNFGCRHDRENDEDASDGDGKHQYGYQFRDEANRELGTIMSYSPRVPYFSNPDISYRGFALGVADTQPRAANNSRVLRENASAMSGRRESVAMPVITQHPQPQTVLRGSRFDLAVTATGGNLQYQWKRDGANIPGALGSTYTRVAAADTDAGSYTVTVSNVVGETTSSAALVAVTAPAASAPAGGVGGGGGGGGGAINPWLVALTGAMFFLRARRNCQKTA